MKIEFKDNKEIENANLDEKVKVDNELKDFVVQYTGRYLQSSSEEITVEDIIEVMSEQFPEFLLAIAEENWVRGYHQALLDVEEGEKIHDSEKIYKDPI